MPTTVTAPRAAISRYTCASREKYASLWNIAMTTVGTPGSAARANCSIRCESSTSRGLPNVPAPTLSMTAGA